MVVNDHFSISSPAALQAEAEALRHDTLIAFLAALALVPILWMAHVLTPEYGGGPDLFDCSVLAMMAAWGAALALHRKRFRAARWVLILGMILAEGLLIAASRQPIVLAFGVLVVLLANALLEAPQALVATLLAGGAATAGWHVATGLPMLGRDAMLIFAMYGLVMAASWLSDLPTHTLVAQTLAGWDRAYQLLAETRERRGDLAKALRALEEATYRIERMNNELLLARQEAEEARAVKTRLMATVSHELRGPLNLILGFSQLMALHPEKYGEPLPLAYYADVDVIYRNSEHLLALIDDILDLSRIEAQRLPLVRDHLDLETDVVLKVIETLRPLAERKGLRLQHQLAGSLPAIFADVVRLRQVLSNLVTNAIRYTERGTITVRTRLEGGEIIVSVEDTGPGIASEDIPRLFKEFSRLAYAETREKAGTGLGLSISKHLIEAHGGRIWVKSQLGHGTSISFALPLPGGVVSCIRESWKRQERLKAHEICLVVHEEPAIIRALSRYMERYRIIGVTKPRETCAIAQEVHPRAIITTPGFAHQIEDDLVDASYYVPIVTLDIPNPIERYRAKGVIGYLSKPITMEMVYALMTQMDHGRETTILLVDDDPDFVRLLETMLTLLPYPYRVQRVYSGAQALERMKAVPPDLVFLDLMMPDMNGEQVLERMRSQESLQHVPVVIISAKEPAEEGLIIAAPIQVHFDKALNMAKGVRILEALLDEITPVYLGAS